MTTLRRHIPRSLFSSSTAKAAGAAAAVAALLAVSACTPAPAGENAPVSGAPSSADSGATGTSGAQGEASAGTASAARILSNAGVPQLASVTPEQLVDRLEALPVAQRPGGLQSSVTAATISLKDAGSGETAELPLPSEKFYLSIAPYAQTTHECTFHAPTGCQGELSSANVGVKIVDAESGEEYVNRTVKTADNGFAGFWLPAGRTVSVTMTVEGKSGTVTTGTGAGDPTCLTTLRVA